MLILEKPVVMTAGCSCPPYPMTTPEGVDDHGKFNDINWFEGYTVFRKRG